MALVIYGVDSPSSFKSVENHFEQIDTYCKNPNLIKILIGNKCDLENDRRVTFDDL